jgi:Ca2+-binding EF-hand superfamily protein
MKQLMFVGALTLVLAMPVAAQAPTGPISKADFLARGKAMFDAGDTNHDGAISKDELTAAIAQQMGSAPPQQMVDSIFTAMDTDHDGKVTAAEGEKLRADSFDRADTNHDGTLTPEEMDAARTAAMAAQQPK